VAYLRGDATLEDELQALEREVADQVGLGMKAFKLKVGEDHERDLERVRLARRIAGPGTYIKVDASGYWEEDEALSRLRDMAEAGADACETPIRALSRPMSRDDPARIEADADGIAEALAKVRDRSPIPIIEHVADLGDVFLTALIRHHAVDIVNVVPCQAGGLRRAKRLIHAAETAGIPALLGSTIELGPGTAASVHLAVASASVSVPSDLVGPGLLEGDVCTTPFSLEGGELTPFEGPGLGIDLDEESMSRWVG
jgi:muconate cycloisomerase